MRPLALLAAVGAGVQPALAQTSWEAAGLLDLHNRERAAAGVAPARWDPALAAQAQGYAQVLARSGRLVHASRTARMGQGENLAMGTRGYYSPIALAAGWAAERRHFRSGYFPAVSRTGRWRDVGHYTQMIWPTSTRVGCGSAAGRTMLVLVCRYAPAGNRDGVRLGR